MPPIDVARTPTRKPESLDGVSATPDGPDVKNAKSVPPDKLKNVRANDLDAKSAAGMELARYVLAFTAAAVFVLVVVLSVFEYKDLGSQTAADDEVLRQTSAGGVFPDPARIEKWSDALRALQTAPGNPSTAPQLAEWRSLADVLGRGGTISRRQIQQLQSCTEPQSADVIASCIELLDMIDREAMSSATNLDKDKLLVEFAKDVDERHQGFRTFFTQLAQMILLNLLLPVLTALLGYIFGTQSKP